MRFGGPPNVGKAATIEHLLPSSKGGTGEMENLRLCHVGCNRHLADRTPEQKERMRINRPEVDPRRDQTGTVTSDCPA
jgi:5-methylcytosine-specific restriction endonuclease McrA